jgi:hypothetical protein
MALLDAFKEWWQKTSGGKADSHVAEAEQKLDTRTAPIAEAGSGSGAEFGALGDKLDAQAGDVGQKPDPGDEGGTA